MPGDGDVTDGLALSELPRGMETGSGGPGFAFADLGLWQDSYRITSVDVGR